MRKILNVLILFTLSFSIVSPVLAAETASETLKGKVVTTGDGIYKDELTEGRYVYKGGNPNNFVNFNNELWRIIAVETDGSLKIIRANALDTLLPFDSDKPSANGFNDGYCAYTSYGCNAWGKINNFENGINYCSGNCDDIKGKVEDDSQVNKLLNGYYYNSLTNNAKNQIISYDYNIGGVYDSDLKYSDYWIKLSYKEKYDEYVDKKNKNENCYDNYQSGCDSIISKYKEKMDSIDIDLDDPKNAKEAILTTISNVNSNESNFSWNGEVAMATVSDVLLASNDEGKCGTVGLINNNQYKKNNCGGKPNSSTGNDSGDVCYLNYEGRFMINYSNNIFNSCEESNYMIPSSEYKFTDYNYLLITPVYGSNETVFGASYQGINPQHVYQEQSSLYNPYYIKPVVHLNSSISITGGDGSENSPYTLSSMGGTSSSNSISSSIAQIVDVPATSMFTSIFVIVGAIVLLGISGYLYLKVFRKKDIN